MMTNLLLLLTALLAASSVLASPGAGYRPHDRRRCAAPSSASDAIPSLSAYSAGATATFTAGDSATPAVPSGGNVYAAGDPPQVAGGPKGLPVGVTVIDNSTLLGNTTVPADTNGSSDSSTNGSTAGGGAMAALPDLSGNGTAVIATAALGRAVKEVFAHFMVGIVSTYKQADWEKDMNVAKAYGITGFALNIGVDPYTEEQLNFAYAAAQATGFKVFISFDFNWYKSSDTAGVSTMLKKYINNPAQYKVEGKPFVSTFSGYEFDWKAAASAVGSELYAVPNWLQDGADGGGNIQGANQGTGMSKKMAAIEGKKALEKRGAKGLFSWHAWPGQNTNKALNAPLGIAQDEKYLNVVGDGTYMAPVSPWFFTHFGKEVSYSKNWLFKSETLWVDRWRDILKLGKSLNFLEIVTWNDYGESHYVGPLDTPHTDDGASKWTKGFPHTAMLDLAVPYIKAFKAGRKAPVVDKEGLVYWYRPHPKGVNCDATDNCGAKPEGWDFVKDSVFVAAMTKRGGRIKVTSGDKAAVSLKTKGGVEVFQVPMGIGKQRFELVTSAGIVNGDGSQTIDHSCWNGNYNFNFFSGAVLF